MKSIELIISPGGSVRLETRGFSGDRCVQEAQFLRRSLGQVTEQTRTPAFYEQAPLAASQPSNLSPSR